MPPLGGGAEWHVQDGSRPKRAVAEIRTTNSMTCVCWPLDGWEESRVGVLLYPQLVYACTVHSHAHFSTLDLIQVSRCDLRVPHSSQMPVIARKCSRQKGHMLRIPRWSITCWPNCLRSLYSWDLEGLRKFRYAEICSGCCGVALRLRVVIVPDSLVDY